MPRFTAGQTEVGGAGRPRDVAWIRFIAEGHPGSLAQKLGFSYKLRFNRPFCLK
jgi:hypothetical protein